MTRRRRARKDRESPLPLLVLLAALYFAWSVVREADPSDWDELTTDPPIPTESPWLPEAEAEVEPPDDPVVEPTRRPRATRRPSPEPEPTDEPTQRPAPREGELSEDERLDQAFRVLDEVNALRREADLPELRMDPILLGTAQAHSEDMAEGDFCDHRGSDGRDLVDRLREAGFEGTYYGENIACGNKTAAQAVDSWTDDKLHRDNVLGPGYRVAGVGVAPGRWGITWTLDLGSD